METNKFKHTQNIRDRGIRFGIWTDPMMTGKGTATPTAHPPLLRDSWREFSICMSPPFEVRQSPFELVCDDGCVPSFTYPRTS